MKIKSLLLHSKLIALAITVSASFTLTSDASEMGISDLFRGKSETLTPFREVAPLSEFKFTSPVDGKSNSWRSALDKAGSSLGIVMKSGQWERPDANELKDIWLSYDQDWAKVNTSGKSLRFTYEFSESTRGAGAVFRFGASEDSRKSHEGNYSLSLVYGQKSCVFTANGQETAGQLPFVVQAGTVVTIDLLPNNTASITIDDLLVLSNQAIVFDENYVTLALVDTSNKSVSPPRVLRLRNFAVSLAD
jgi:hypothetical protein